MLIDTIRQLIAEEIDDFRFNTMLIEIDQITQAKDFARDVHKGQWRKGTPIPYIAHPMRVYHRAKKRGLSKTHQLLAILHDTYEDAKNPKQTLKKIKEVFGDKIANLVLILSHDRGVDYKAYLLKLANKSKIGFEVKLLDMEDNLSDKPSPKQKNKYKEALEYLINNGITIDKNVAEKLFKLAGVTV